MVVLDYYQMDNLFQEVKQAACGRQACSVIIIVANEVDAMASAKILTQLLRSENVAYKLRPVANFSHIASIVEEFTTSEIKTVFMINCGAVRDIELVLIDNCHRFTTFQSSFTWSREEISE